MISKQHFFLILFTSRVGIVAAIPVSMWKKNLWFYYIPQLEINGDKNDNVFILITYKILKKQIFNMAQISSFITCFCALTARDLCQWLSNFLCF